MRDDEQDPACIDCALRNHDTCLERDHEPIGRRECCCGVETEIDPWG